MFTFSQFNHLLLWSDLSNSESGPDTVALMMSE